MSIRGFTGLAIAGNEECLQSQLEAMAANAAINGGTMAESMAVNNDENHQDGGNGGINEVSDILFNKNDNTCNIYINNEVTGAHSAIPPYSRENNTLTRHSAAIQPPSMAANAAIDFSGYQQPIDNAELEELLQKIPAEDRFAVRQEFEKRYKLDNEGAWAWLVNLIAEKAEK